MSEIINLYDELNRSKDIAENSEWSLTYHLLLKVTLQLYPDLETNVHALEVELKINGKDFPIVSFLQEYEKYFDEEVSEKASELVEEKMSRLTEMLLRLIRERKRRGIEL